MGIREEFDRFCKQIQQTPAYKPCCDCTSPEGKAYGFCRKVFETENRFILCLHGDVTHGEAIVAIRKEAESNGQTDKL